MGQGATLALAFAAILAGALALSSGVRNRGLSEVLAGITNPRVESGNAAEPGGSSPSGSVAPSAKSIREFFEGKGLSNAQAAGIVGNFSQESALNPNAPGGGLDQGQGSRAHGGPLLSQLEAIWAELMGPERGSLAALRHTRTPEQAARVFSQRFERPEIPNLPAREKYAREAAVA